MNQTNKLNENKIEEIKEPFKGESWRRGYMQGIKESREEVLKDFVDKLPEEPLMDIVLVNSLTGKKSDAKLHFKDYVRSFIGKYLTETVSNSGKGGE